jgi:hypothetical protein
MISQIDGYYIAAQIRLVRQASKRAILVLEGETDARVFDRFIDQGTCDIEIGFGKANVIEAIDLLEDEGFVGVVGVVDADFDRLIGTQHGLENLCLTDCHDLDLTIFSSLALERYLAEYADVELIRTRYNSDFQLLRREILTSAIELSHCRLVSERDGLRLYFKDLRHDEYIDLDLVVDVSLLTSDVVQRSTTRCTVDQLQRLIQVEACSSHDMYQLTNGHDVGAVLGIACGKFSGAAE